MEKLPELHLSVDLGEIELNIDAASGQVVASSEMSLLMSWTDDRLVDPVANPCLIAWAEGVSLPRASASSIEVQAQKMANLMSFGLGTLGDVSNPNTASVKQEFTLALNPEPDNLTLAQAHTANLKVLNTLRAGASVHGLYQGPHLVQFELVQQVQISQQETRPGGSLPDSPSQLVSGAWNFYYYPFDQHSVVFEILTGGFNTTTCGTDALWGGGAASIEAQSRLFPGGGEWRLVRAPYSLQISGGGCAIYLPIRRISTTYIVNQLVPHSIIVIASLFSMVLDPTSADTAAGRVSVLLVAALLLVESTSAARYQVPSFLWEDLLNLLVVSIIAIAIVETFVLHWLSRRGVMIVALDRMFRVMIPTGYFLATGGLLSWASDESHSPRGLALIVIGGLCMMVLAGICYLKAQARWLESRRHKVLSRLADIDTDDAELPHIMRHVLRLYDSDRSGSFSYGELVVLLHAVYPDLDPRQLTSLMNAVGWREDLEVEVTPEELQATLSAFRDLLSNPDVDGQSYRFKRTSSNAVEIAAVEHSEDGRKHSSGRHKVMPFGEGQNRRSTAVRFSAIMTNVNSSVEMISSTSENPVPPPPPSADNVDNPPALEDIGKLPLAAIKVCRSSSSSRGSFSKLGGWL